MKRFWVLLLVFVGCGGQQVVKDGARWPNTPILVYCHDSVNEIAYGACDESVRLWNTAVGFNLFEKSSRFGNVAILPSFDVLRTQQKAGLTSYYILHDIEFVYASVEWDVSLPPDAVLRTLTHELGHVAGLRHSEDKECVMFDSISEEPAPWYICEQSARFLQELYAP